MPTGGPSVWMCTASSVRHLLYAALPDELWWQRCAALRVDELLPLRVLQRTWMPYAELCRSHDLMLNMCLFLSPPHSPHPSLSIPHPLLMRHSPLPSVIPPTPSASPQPLQVKPEDIPSRVSSLQDELRSARSELEKALADLAVVKAESLVSQAETVGSSETK